MLWQISERIEMDEVVTTTSLDFRITGWRKGLFNYVSADLGSRSTPLAHVVLESKG
jgi:hypothetical protein